MIVKLVGCSHHQSSIEVREKVAFSPAQIETALQSLKQKFPAAEAVILSTCNRTELYTASQNENDVPSHDQLVSFLAEFHGIKSQQIEGQLFRHDGHEVIRHLFTVAASLDSMVVGEAQIIQQVKEAYQLATKTNTSMSVSHSIFQAALRVAKRVANETTIHQRRISIPSVAIGDFAKQIFETFHDKQVLVIGAGEMGEETLVYLKNEGAKNISVVNRTLENAEKLAEKFGGQAKPWDALLDELTKADLVISTTGSKEHVITLENFTAIEAARAQRVLFMLDLAVPRDIDPAIDQMLNVYLYSLDDLKAQCEENQKARKREWPAAKSIIDDETKTFMAEINHRSTGPTIKRLKEQATQIKDAELARLMNKIEGIDAKTKTEIEYAFHRLVNKILHPPLESLRDEAESGNKGLVEALRRLFKIGD